MGDATSMNVTDLRARRHRDVGEVLLDEGLITEEQLARARQEQATSDRSLGRILLDLQMVKETELVAALARKIGLPFVDLTEFRVDPAAVALVPEQVAQRYRAIPIGFDGAQLVVAMSDPANVYAIDDIRAITNMEIKPVVATASDVDDTIRNFGHFDRAVEEVASEAASQAKEDGEADLEASDSTATDAPMVTLVNMLISQAIADRASDIHVEPTDRDVRVRFRIDGVLHEVMRPPKQIQNGIVSRVKVMADMNIAERRRPQDGRVGLVVAGKAVDLRLATLPTVHGEKVSIRILDKSSVLLGLEELGFDPDALARYERAFRKPYGTILITGPTGSGKTTTLYATLNTVSTPDRNVITVEDPVEYRLPGVNQMQVNSKASLTFANALRSILRSDPDVVMVGEIRDRETAQIAVEAALTGHLVLTSIHTSTAASAMTRLIEMGVEPYLVASALDCVVAQRLARRLCERCKERYRPSREELLSLGFSEEDASEIKHLHRPIGCSACSSTGFRGRVGLFEVLTVSEEIETLTVERGWSEEIERTAIQQGMVSLLRDGLEKVRRGETSPEELLRVVT